MSVGHSWRRREGMVQILDSSGCPRRGGGGGKRPRWTSQVFLFVSCLAYTLNEAMKPMIGRGLGLAFVRLRTPLAFPLLLLS
jgi:hypothetical protein